MTAPPLKITFKGSQGHDLAARLDLPSGHVRAYALFAHCFTCSKDVFAASRIADGLAAEGFAVLRFDFTGLGASEGEFANTNFSSNVADLLHAADYLRKNHKAPALLVGHSLGGAAVLAAAGDIPEATAVVTIGAPSDAAHVLEHFSPHVDEIEKRGEAEVSLAGRPFRITKAFLEDVRGTALAERIGNLKRALLILHAPRDEIVGIENASAIFTAAQHPKSFISLDTADHLLTDRADAAYAADIIEAWAARYLPAEEAKPEQGDAHGFVTVTETGNGKFQQRVVSGRHELLADEPEEMGGSDTGPSPYDFLAIALGACTSMTLRLYAQRKKLALDRVSVKVAHDKEHLEDCDDCENKNAKVDVFTREIGLSGDLAPDKRKRLLEIADLCPVHKTLSQKSRIVTRPADEP